MCYLRERRDGAWALSNCIMLRDFDFSKLTCTRKRAVLYAADGNKVVKHWLMVYGLEQITDCSSHEGLYLQYIQDEYNPSYRVFNDLGADMVPYGWLFDWMCKEDIIEALAPFVPFVGMSGYRAFLAQEEQRGGWINNSHVRALLDNGEADLAKHYQQYHDMQLEERELRDRERHEQALRQQAARERMSRLYVEERVDKAERGFLEHVSVTNEKSDHFDGKCVILHLMRKYGIEVPPRTKGWIGEKLICINWTVNGGMNYTYLRGKNCKPSDSAFDCLHRLNRAIMEALSNSGKENVSYV